MEIHLGVTMRFGAYVLFLFAFACAFYMFGQKNAIQYVLGDTVTVNGTTISPLDTGGNAVYGGKPLDASTFAQRLISLFSSPSSIAALALILGVAGVVTALGGFSSIYFIPMVLVLIISNFVLMPFGSFFVFDQTCSAQVFTQQFNNTSIVSSMLAQCQTAQIPFYEPIILFFNIITVLAIVSFVRGGV